MNTLEAVMAGYTGPAAQPRRLVLRLPGGQLVLSSAVPDALARAVATYLTGSGPRARLPDGTLYTSAPSSLIAEVAAQPHADGTFDILRVY
ncbi:hypothetical protein ACFQ60_01985 [Streptomyces zhihengii]|uniref:Uncharacterized protein n=1 Tax=Streptomyces zhihengii TaxID=1818004 RepID=A0ABS2V380_9ACTN|nr:hypothetical protein [Streptomyces zhihengii]MBM9624190.1 hypothetical protein [Streptomyces zhihengii]